MILLIVALMLSTVASQAPQCANNPCGDGGLCFPNNDGTFVCLCSAGFAGPKCAEKNECLSNPCKNGASCLDLIDAFLCKCTPNFTGTTCEISLTQTITTSTSTTSTLSQSTNSSQVTALCPNQEICQNQGLCVILTNGNINTFMCICPQGYSGDFCEQPNATTTTTTSTLKPLSCSPNPCKNNGDCVSSTSGAFYGCFCKPGFYGTYCDFYTSTPSYSSFKCNPNPCWNNGVCQSDTNGNFLNCQCQSGWYGAYCDFASQIGK